MDALAQGGGGGGCGGGGGGGGGRRRGRAGTSCTRARVGGARVSISRFVAIYSQALALVGTAILGAVLITDTRWLGQIPEIVVLFGAAVALRGLFVPLSKYSYLTQAALVGITGSLLVGVPATALAIAGATLVTDSAWQRKPLRVGWINLGREVITVVAAYGVYATVLHWLGMPGAPAITIELLPALVAYALVYFLFGRLLFYFSLIIRAKLEPTERSEERRVGK